MESRPTYQLDTPCLVLDLEVLEQNLQKMQQVATAANKALRPHAKTHKCSALGRRQLEAGAIGLCAAKVSEAEALVRAGINEILVTGPVASAVKARRLVALLDACPALMTVVDSAYGLDLLDEALKSAGKRMTALIDVDVGLQRSGVKPAAARKLAEQLLQRSTLRLGGIQAYAGQVQHLQDFQTRRRQSLDSLHTAAQVFRDLRRLTPECKIFSGAGTGTFDIDVAVPELTELQVGSYVCMDAEYLGIGSAADSKRFSAFAPALRLLTTVVSCNQDGFCTVDAGLKALYRDGAVPQFLGPAAAGWRYDWFGDEYGRVTADAGVSLPPLGSVLELVVSHCDPTVNLFDCYHLVRDGVVLGTWPIDLRGCSQ